MERKESKVAEEQMEEKVRKPSQVSKKSMDNIERNKSVRILMNRRKSCYVAPKKPKT